MEIKYEKLMMMIVKDKVNEIYDLFNADLAK